MFRLRRKNSPPGRGIFPFRQGDRAIIWDRPERGGPAVTVYIDLLFLLNLTANYLLLLAAGRIAGAVLRRWRIGLGGALGALYAVLIFLPGLGWLAAWPC